MHCPKCAYAEYDPGCACPECGFAGDPDQVRELDHIVWLFGEMGSWPPVEVPRGIRHYLEQVYQVRRRNLEIALSLRPAPFSKEEAEQAWPTLHVHETWCRQIVAWSRSGLLGPTQVQLALDQAKQQIATLRERLAGSTIPVYPRTDRERLDIVSALIEQANALGEVGGFVTPEAREQALAPLHAERERLERKLGLALKPEASGKVVPARSPKKAEPLTDAAPAPAATSRTPPPPAVPFRERLWQTLVSERTLRAMLFLGIFLLFAAAISFVVWGWRDFSPLLRIAIPVCFTVLFFVLGRYVRVGMRLYRSGIALSAIAALLIPIDLYTAFVNLEVPAHYWPEFWSGASLVSLIAYIAITLAIRSGLFGYLVGAAAGSLVLAAIEMGHKAVGLSRDWSAAGLSALAVTMILIGTALMRDARRRAYIFADPLRYMGLLAAGVLMPLTLGWRYVDRTTYDVLHDSLTVTWWLGVFALGWGAVQYRSRALGTLTVVTLPVAAYLAQAAIFQGWGINPAWHALGWAGLVLVYFTAGWWLGRSADDPVRCDHGRTAVGWGIVLLVLAALWSFIDLSSGAAAAISHLILSAAVVLAAVLWRRPRVLYAASLLAFSGITFATAELGLTLAQSSVAWASLALVHVIAALWLGSREPDFSSPLVGAGYVIATLALLPALWPYDGHLLAYVLGNWLGLAGWGAYLAYHKQPGFKAEWTIRAVWRDPLLRMPAPWHWGAALGLPFWVWVLFTNRRYPDPSLALALAALAWGMLMLAHYLELKMMPERRGSVLAAQPVPACCQPWRLVGHVVNAAAPLFGWVIDADMNGGNTLAVCLLSAGLLLFVDSRRHPNEMLPAGLGTAWGCLGLMNWLHLIPEVKTLVMALLAAFYLARGLWAQWQVRRGRTNVPWGPKMADAARFFRSLYWAAHLLAGLVVMWVYIYLLFAHNTDRAALWGAAAQLVLGAAYGFYAWGQYKERWAHIAAWLGATSGGLLAVVYSQGRGSSAAKAAVIAILFVLSERALFQVYQRWYRWLPAHWLPLPLSRLRAGARLAWRLYRRPLLVVGWTASMGTIGLALVRNLLLLGGGRTQQIWAIVGLMLIVALYTLAAWMFRRADFAWLAAVLIIAPWTILTNLGWYIAKRPTWSGFAVGWVALAWVLFLVGLILDRFRSGRTPLVPAAYTRPATTVAHLLLPLALLWGGTDVDTGCLTFGLAAAFYGLAAWLDERQYRRAEGAAQLWNVIRFRFPVLALVPVWCVFLLARLLPHATVEPYSWLFLLFGGMSLAVGRWTPRLHTRSQEGGAAGSGTDGALAGERLPAYLVGYGSLLVGTLLAGSSGAHPETWLSLALLYDALLLILSARLFRHPLWIYPAAVSLAASLALAVGEADVPFNRLGWWLLGLAAVYLALAWLLRRVRLSAYGTGPLAAGLALIAVSLIPCSLDRVGAMWGYGVAALLYTWAAFWLRRPLLLAPACALAPVPYVIGLQRSILAPEFYGLALWPGAILAILVGWILDRIFGKWSGFPWSDLFQWPQALAERLLKWWALAPYTLGFGLAMASPFWTDSKDLRTLTLALLVLLFGWAIYAFRLRGWLLAATLAGQLAAVSYLDVLRLWATPARAWLWFTPVTVVITLVALGIERHRAEGPPWRPRVPGWSHPLYWLAALDLVAVQWASLGGVGTDEAAVVTLVHALLLGIVATAWQSGLLSYLSAVLGVVTLGEWLVAQRWQTIWTPVAFARLVVGYGAVGCMLTWLRGRQAELEALAGRSIGRVFRIRPEARLDMGWVMVWEHPLIHSALVLSWGVLALAAWLGIDLVPWTVRALLGLSFREIVDLQAVYMAMGVLSLLGLFYVAFAVTRRRLRLGYLAVGLLLAGWTLYAFYVREWDGLARVQWYAMPAGLYLLGISYLEWGQGNRRLARWLDYAAMLLMIGSLFWQTLLFGWRYALMLGAEGLIALWWGSARRLRHFFYAGMVGVVLATLGQLINSLQSINQWVVFGIIGLLFVIVAALVERKLEAIRASLQEVFEEWD